MATKIELLRLKRRERKAQLREQAELTRLQQPIIDLVQSQLPCHYKVYFNEDGQLIVENTHWLDVLQQRAYENASHWLNDRGIFA